jgi:uncharacterized phage protein gp47/JayE
MSDNLNFPEDRTEIFDNLSTDFQAEIPESNPTLKNSWLRALLMSIASAVFGIYERLKVLSTQVFIKTATGDNLLNLGNIWVGNKLAATISTGFISVTGTASTVIPANTLFQTGGLQYKTLSEVTIAATVQNVSSLTWSANVATATTASNHGLATGMSATIAGAAPAGLNGTFTIIVTGEDTYTYTTTESGSGSATGTITSTSTFAGVQVESLLTGSDKNQDAGVQLTLVTPISGASTAFVQFSEIVGGTDLETDEEYRDTVTFRIQNPVANFNVAAIENQINELGFVERIFVQEITPGLGQVTIYNLKANNEVPTSTELTIIKDKVLEIKPANTPDNAVFVLAPTLVPTDFTFSSITPDTSTMRTAIENSLTVFFETIPDIGTNITETQYTNAIINTVDQETGDLLIDYTLSSPSGNIIISSGEIGTLGNVIFT